MMWKGERGQKKKRAAQRRAADFLLAMAMSEGNPHIDKIYNICDKGLGWSNANAPKGNLWLSSRIYYKPSGFITNILDLLSSLQIITNPC